MKITHDEPGQLLALEGDAPALPAAVGRWVAGIAIGLALIPTASFVLTLRHVPPPGTIEIVLSAVSSLFWLGLIGGVLLAAWSATWMPTLVRVDGISGRLRIVERQLLTRKDREEVIALADIQSLRVTATGTGAPRLTFRRSGPGGKGRERAWPAAVDAVDTRAEVIDLAYRLAAVIGLFYQRMVRNDPRQLEMELGRTAGPGYTPAPATAGRADYVRDRVAPEAVAAAAREQIPPFDPVAFRSDHRVAQWSPGERVEFRKSIDLGVGCLPFGLAAFLAAPALYLNSVRHPGSDAPPLAAILVVGFFGVVFGAVALVIAYASLPRRVTLDWMARTIRIREGFTQREIDFSNVTGLQLKCVRSHHRSGSRSSTHYDVFSGEVLADVRDPVTSLNELRLLVRTAYVKNDPEPPYAAALPLVTELAAALGVKRQVVDYPSRG